VQIGLAIRPRWRMAASGFTSGTHGTSGSRERRWSCRSTRSPHQRPWPPAAHSWRIEPPAEAVPDRQPMNDGGADPLHRQGLPFQSDGLASRAGRGQQKRSADWQVAPPAAPQLLTERRRWHRGSPRQDRSGSWEGGARLVKGKRGYRVRRRGEISGLGPGWSCWFASLSCVQPWTQLRFVADASRLIEGGNGGWEA